MRRKSDRSRTTHAGAALAAAITIAAGGCAEPGAPEVGSRRAGLTAPPELHAYLADVQLPLVGVEAGAGQGDLRPLAATLGDARVIAMGEATHGSREIFQLKHRLLEYLVAERGVTIFGFEAGYGEARDVDAYVQGRPGDGDRAIAGLGYWPWMTEEVVDLVEWMRRWNRTHAQKVHFVGFDMQVPDRALRDTLAYLRAVDPGEAPRFEASLQPATSRYDFFTVDPEAYDAMRIEAEALLALLDDRAALYRARSSDAAFTEHRQLARVVVQSLAMTYADFTGDEWEGSNVRDAAMADNVEWLLAQAGGGRVALWAHNDHVSKDHWAPEWTNLGSHLAARLGDDYRVIGSAFDRGGFQALGATLRLEEFVVASGGAETLDGVLAEAVAPQALVPLAALPAGPVADYFAAPPLHRDVTAGYLEDFAEEYFRPVPVADYYDVLAFVGETTRARPLVYARDQITPQATNPAPANLGFEDGIADDGVPAGWFAPIANQVGGYRVTTTPALPYAGHRSAVLVRTTARGYGKDYGELRQRIRAVPYRGQRVRVRAAVRAITGERSRVHLFARSGAAYDGMHDRPITTSGWQTYDLVLDIGATATRLDLGLVLVGDGVAWIDDVTITPIPR